MYSIRSIDVEEGHVWEQVMDQFFGGYGKGDFQKIMVMNYDYDPERVRMVFDERGFLCATATSWRQHFRWGPGIGDVLFVGAVKTHQRWQKVFAALGLEPVRDPREIRPPLRCSASTPPVAV